MKTIHKFPVVLTDKLLVNMPEFPRILSCQLQNGIPMVWALVETDNEKFDYEFVWYGTGNRLDTDDHEFVDTVQVGLLVFHLFYAGRA
jgi:hypothetical protein